MKYVYILSGLILLTVLLACYQEKNNLFTTANLTIDAGDTLTIQKMEAAITLTNLNTTEQVVVNTLSANVVETVLLKGIYRVYAQGSVTVTNAKGVSSVRRFRVSEDAIQLSGEEKSYYNLQLFFVP